MCVCLDIDLGLGMIDWLVTRFVFVKKWGQIRRDKKGRVLRESGGVNGIGG